MESRPGAETAPEAGGVEIWLNGDRRAVRSGLSLHGLLAGIGVDPGRVAVERNGRIVPRGTYDEVAVEPGDALEVVRIVGGGTHERR